MNEAEIQAAIANFIRTSLPTFQETEITEQRTFSLKMGHHNIIVDGKKPTKYAKRAIYDILLKLNGKPFILLELKRPGLAISADDIAQGVSYARLTEEITPITVITNGTQTKIINTYTKEEITDLTTDVFTHTITHGANLATNNFKDTIEELLNNDKEMVFDLVNSISESNFASLTGKIDEFNKPICPEFIVERELGETIYKQFDAGNFKAIIGDPFVGKTNLLFQLFQNLKQQGHGFLYLNMLDLYVPVLSKIATLLTAKLKFAVTTDQVRNWLILNFNDDTDVSLIIVYDHLRYDINNDQKTELAELIDLFTPTKNKIIIVTDRGNFQRFAKDEYRNLNTVIGEKFVVNELTGFSSEEYDLANKQAHDSFRMSVFAGGIYSKEYRTPRLWRILVWDREQQRPGEHLYGIINPIPGPEFIDIFTHMGMLNGQLVADLKLLGQAYIENIPAIRKNAELALMAFHMALIEESYMKKFVDPEIVDRLISAGFLEKRFVGDYNTIYVPKVPEVLSAFSIDHILSKVIHLCAGNFEQGYHYLMNTCEYLPYGELIAGDMIMTLGGIKPDLFEQIMNRILFDKPIIEISKGAKLIGIFNPQKDATQLVDIDTGEPDKLVGNIFPYLVLSHLCAYRFGDDSEHPDVMRFRVMNEIATIDFQIRRPDDFGMHEGIPIYEFEGVGGLVQTNIGIVEPIVQSLMTNIIKYPSIAKGLMVFAKKEKLYILCHRLYIASKGTIQIVGDKPPAATFIAEYEDQILPEIMAVAMAGKSANRAKRREVKHRLYKIRKKK